MTRWYTYIFGCLIKDYSLVLGSAAGLQARGDREGTIVSDGRWVDVRIHRSEVLRLESVLVELGHAI